MYDLEYDLGGAFSHVSQRLHILELAILGLGYGDDVNALHELLWELETSLGELVATANRCLQIAQSQASTKEAAGSGE
jgi:hypothetical protein